MAKPSSAVTLYLLAYNAFNAVAWGYIFYLGISTIWPGYVSGQDWTTTALATWDVVERPVRFVQTLAVMEILHAAVGIVRSPVGSTITQNAARMWVLWCALVLCPTSRAQAGFPMVVLSWSIVEVPRYTFYALNLFNAVPAPIFFLRYHLFMVLYPSGFLGEFLCLYNSLPYLEETGKYAIAMPNAHNISISLATGMRMMLVFYTIGLFVMYNHMLAMRRRAYAKLKTA